jgi:hypothetical protein
MKRNTTRPDVHRPHLPALSALNHTQPLREAMLILKKGMTHHHGADDYRIDSVTELRADDGTPPSPPHASPCHRNSAFGTNSPENLDISP